MKRKELINELIQKSGDEFESKQDYINLAYMTKKQLVKSIIKVNQYIINNK
jgi:hypothetical protein